MPLFIREFECPSCGGRIQRQNPASKSLSCPYCGQTSHITGGDSNLSYSRSTNNEDAASETLEKVGGQHLLIDYGSMFSIGMSATLHEIRFRVLGRIRISYEDGFWDEWYVERFDNNTTAWIQEDDGSFTWFKYSGDTPNVKYEAIQVGSVVTFSNELEHVFITSKSRAVVQGGEGELPFAIIPNDRADFVEGIHQKRVISIEILDDGNHTFVGVPFNIDDLTIH